jgi:TonB family protein
MHRRLNLLLLCMLVSGATAWAKEAQSALKDFEGKVQNIRLVRAAGMGMEEQAVAAVSTWRFKPAQREGEPVAVEMNIEVAFNKF